MRCGWVAAAPIYAVVVARPVRKKQCKCVGYSFAICGVECSMFASRKRDNGFCLGVAT